MKLSKTNLHQALASFAMAASLAVSGDALAQAAKSTPAPAAPAVASPAAAPVAVTPEQKAAIKELLDVMNTRENLSKTYGAMAQALAPQMAQAMNQQIETNATLTPEQKTKVRAGMTEPFNAAVKEGQGLITNPKLVDETLDKMYAIFARYYTAAEAKQLVAFYKSPIGAKTLTAMPQATNESLQAGVAIFQPRVVAVMDKTLKSQIDAATKK